MDYSKLKKDELLVLVTEQQALADTVHAKDAEIRKLVKEKEELKTKVYEYSHLAKNLEAREKQLEVLQNALETERVGRKKEVQGLNALLEEQKVKIEEERKIDVILENNEELRKDAEFAINIANKYINVFRNYLKVQQGALDNMLEMEALLTKQIQTKEV